VVGLHAVSVLTVAGQRRTSLLDCRVTGLSPLCAAHPGVWRTSTWHGYFLEVNLSSSSGFVNQSTGWINHGYLSQYTIIVKVPSAMQYHEKIYKGWLIK
jgi:hypothetical protein